MNEILNLRESIKSLMMSEYRLWDALFTLAKQKLEEGDEAAYTTLLAAANVHGRKHEKLMSVLQCFNKTFAEDLEEGD